MLARSKGKGVDGGGDEDRDGGRVEQKVEEFDPKLLKTRSQELDKLSSILTSRDHIEHIVSCNLELELGGGQDVGYTDLSGILVHIREKTDRLHFLHQIYISPFTAMKWVLQDLRRRL